MATSRLAPELSIYGSQCDPKSCFLILPILHYRNSPILSSPVGFSRVTHLNMRSGEHAQFCKTVLRAGESVLSAQGMRFSPYALSFLFQVYIMPSPPGDCGSLAKCSSDDMPQPHQPHVGLMGDWAQPAAHFGLEGFPPAKVSLHYHPGTTSSVDIMHRGCLSLSISFIAHFYML